MIEKPKCPEMALDAPDDSEFASIRLRDGDRCIKEITVPRAEFPARFKQVIAVDWPAFVRGESA